MADQHATNSQTEQRPAPARSPESVASHGGAHLAAPRSAVEPTDGTAKGILKEAIQKVMEEIQFHEKEAQKHRQQADTLKRDLRDSFAFLQEQKGRGKTPDAAESIASRTEKDTAGMHGRAQGDTKKKGASGKGKARKG